MNVFEYAMKMEEDGRAYYLEHAEKASVPSLKKVLLELADDELKHYHLFKAMHDDETVEYKESEKTAILSTVKTVFEVLKAENKDMVFPDDETKTWETAREIEKKAEAFYREKAAELTDENQKRVFELIADEEHRHWTTLEHVIRFLEHPRQWLEDAEWSRLEEY